MTRRAILIASSKFPEEKGLPDLECPENDVDGMQAVLEAADVGQFDEVRVLKNEESWKVKKLLNKTLRASKKRDVVLIYYSGHGKLSRTGHLCLTTPDTEFDMLDATSIHTDEIKRYVSTSDCRQVALLLDCCYSGAAGKSFLRSSADDQLQLMTQDQAGLFIMTASTGVQTAEERRAEGYGLFTQHVIEGLKQGAADLNGDGHVTVDELFDYVEQRVMNDGAQAPKKWGLGVQGTLVMAKGRSSWSGDLRRDAKKRLLQLSGDDVLPDAILTSALRLLAKEQSALDAREKRWADLIAPLVAGDVPPARFISSWYEIRESVVETPAATPAKKKKDPPPAKDAPKLRTKPARKVDFGTLEEGRREERELQISNAAGGELEWSHRSEGGFFQARRTKTGLKLIVRELDVGSWEGAVEIESNGGSKRVAVHVVVEEEDEGYEVDDGFEEEIGDGFDGPAALMPASEIVPGRWQIEMVTLGFVKTHFLLDFLPGGQANGNQTLMGMTAAIYGGWGYDPMSKVLTLQITAQMAGMQGSDVLQVQINGGDGRSYTGVDGMGRKFTLTRMG